ncbi:cytochrome B [Rhodanobacter thiooxydans]|uniref:Cytochrome B n=1 Tax=Rhodanobacter thiooxydans TaxID=416169 RepID=A0A154QL74_9GAMM|nr:cytochrome b [Rhodanobacter thiooxydans]EIM01495.1 cytochrome B561 [Rhodanobacter thiooxydans LCS2]KZC25037.1 cytochrome B [Rhodanobacter thiooxydans]MCW0202250.1 cytochrome b [Rhodanobacter thiooxydans]
MSLRSSDRRWGSVAKFFHWIIALGILGNGLFGLLMDLASSPMQKINWLALHKSIGLTVLALVLLRIAWRWTDRRPAEEPAPRWQQLAAHAAHGALYVLIVLLPLSGWWFNSVTGKPLQWFKLFNLPALAQKNDALRDFAHGVHEYLFWFLILVLVAHVGGALKHHLLDHDNTLRRMLPFGRLRAPPASEGDSR